MLDIFLKNEISIKREAGTYLFYGEDSEKNYKLALEFASEIFCRDIEDENLKLNIRDKVHRNIYSDLNIITNITIDDVREMIKISNSSSHEGGAKVFILKNIQDARKESINAMLKVIEEPIAQNFFILLSNRLNILSTIRSRSIIYKVKKDKPEDLQVDKYIFDFFRGISKDIQEYKTQNLDLSIEKSYTLIGSILKEYEQEPNITNKVSLYNSLRDFVREAGNLKIYEKVKFAEDIYANISNKENIKLIVEYIIELTKREKNLRDKLFMKKMIRFPINMKLFFIKFICSI